MGVRHARAADSSAGRIKRHSAGAGQREALTEARRLVAGWAGCRRARQLTCHSFFFFCCLWTAFQTRIQRIQLDFPLFARFYRFPSLLHLGASLSPAAFDWLLQLLLVIGTVSGLVAALGVGDSRIALFVCWAIYLSYANMVQLLIYPWSVRRPPCCAAPGCGLWAEALRCRSYRLCTSCSLTALDSFLA